jgi:hypothetical protein
MAKMDCTSRPTVNNCVIYIMVFWNVIPYKECRLVECYALWFLQEPRAVKTSNLTLIPYSLAERLGYVRSEVFTAVTMKDGVFWDVTLCGSCNWYFFAVYVGCWLQLVLFLVHRFLSPDEGGARFLRNVGSHTSHVA